MDKNEQEYENNYDFLKDVTEFQENMFNPGYYVGTGKVPPTVSAPGNAMPLAVLSFVASAISLAFGLFLLLSDAEVVFGVIKLPIANKIIALLIFIIISVLFSVFGFAYLKKAKRYYKQKNKLENETFDEEVKDEIRQRTCPKCGKTHDIDYPKCPYCKFDYNNNNKQ